MSWNDLVINGGTTSTGLVVGTQETGATYGAVTLSGEVGNPGTLENGELRTGGTITLSSGGVVDGLTASGANARILMNGGTLYDINLSGGAQFGDLAGGTIAGGTVIFQSSTQSGGFGKGTNIYCAVRDLTITMDNPGTVNQYAF